MERSLLLVHGGAWSIPDEEVEPSRLGMEEALRRGSAVLAGGGSAIDAVVAAVGAMEEDPTFDAGVGSVLNLEGRVEMDASIMDGATRRAGAVGAVDLVKSPIRLARALMDHGRHVFLTGAGAVEAARRFGLELTTQEALVIPREHERWQAILRTTGFEIKDPFDHPQGTVGAVARDQRGRLAAATSTGGAPGKWPGRLGDSPVLGSGTYADDDLGACSATGWGESILRAVLAHDAVERCARPTAEATPARIERPIIFGPDATSQAALHARDAIARLESRFKGLGGVILIGADGSVGWAFNTPRMNRGVWQEGDAPRTWVDR